MRGVVGALVVAATAVAGVPVASAGTYDVVSCGAPGAGGVNRAWQPESAGSRPADGRPGSRRILRPRSRTSARRSCSSAPRRQTAPPRRSSRAATGCSTPRPALASPASRPGDSAYGCGRPPTTRTPNPEATRATRGGSSPAIEGAQLIGGVFGENCAAPPGAIGCSFGERRRRSALRRALSTPSTSRGSPTPCRARASSGCPRTTAGHAVATVKVFGTRVTIRDNTAPRARRSAAPLLAAGWRKPGDA